MTGLLGQLGKSLADKWLSLLVLPGALYLAVTLAARTLGQGHPLDLSRLAHQVTIWARNPAAATAGGQLVFLAAALAAAAGVGLAAHAFGGGILNAALAANWRTWPPLLRALASRRVASRRRRWDEAHRVLDQLRDEAARAAALRQPHDSAPRHAARRTLTRIALERPDRPTWSGDRIHTAAVRLDRDHRIDLAMLWPHLWLTLPGPQRAEITAARDTLTQAATLGGWAMLYLPLSILWWPAALLAIFLAFTARRRIRAAAHIYAQLLEAATRLYTGTLARELGIEHTGTLPADIGERLASLLDSPQPTLPGGTATTSESQPDARIRP